MSEFLTVLQPSPLGDGVQWAHMVPFRYRSDIGGLIEILPNQPGSVTDFASIPKPIQNIYPVWGRYGGAACVHDFLYWTQTTTQAVADSILREAMLLLGVDDVTVAAIYAGVRLGGAMAWAHNSTLKASGYRKMVPLGQTNPPYAGIPQ